MAKRGEERERGKETRREGVEKTKKKNNRGQENSRRMEDLGWGRRSGKVWRRGQETGSSKVPQVDLCLQKERKWEDANKSVGLCDRSK